MKTKLFLPIAAAALVALGAPTGTAVGASPRALFAKLTSDLRLRPGVSRAGHPRVNPPGLYGAFDAVYDRRSGKVRYALRWKGLVGSGFRAVIRSRATGAAYAVLCSPCRAQVKAVRSGEGLPIYEARGAVTVSRDVAYLLVGTHTFLEVDTTAYPSGEIGAPVFGEFVYPGPPKVQGEPRCC